MKSRTLAGKRTKHIRKVIAIIMMGLVLVSIIPTEVHAAALSKKSKGTYSLSVADLSNSTVVKRGGSYKVNARATLTKAGVTKSVKVRFKSSNKKIATVSSKGVIRGKKNGTVKITVSCKGKKKKYKIKVGTPVSSISISGYNHINKGRQTTLKANCNSGATNKSVSWSSSDPEVASVNSSGVVTAKGYGSATITAKAIDGSGTKGSTEVAVHSYEASDTKWIAHRGLHITENENTAGAFRAAGQAGGFWGCECDIWETKHEQVAVESEVPDSEQTDENTDNGEPSEAQGDALDNIASEGAEETVEDAEGDVTNQSNDNTDETIQPESTDGEDQTTPEKQITYVDTFDLVINHDETFARTQGVNRTVKSMTASEIRAKIPKACFYEEYLDICKQYNMVPVVEFKDKMMSDEAVHKAVDMLYERDQLKDACLISFFPDLLERVNDYATEKLGYAPYTAYLINYDDLNAVDHADAKGFTCISVSKTGLSQALYDKCCSMGIKVGTWTYRENAMDDYYLYLHAISGQYNIDFATVDYKPFN